MLTKNSPFLGAIHTTHRQSHIPRMALSRRILVVIEEVLHTTDQAHMTSPLQETILVQPQV